MPHGCGCSISVIFTRRARSGAWFFTGARASTLTFQTRCEASCLRENSQRCSARRVSTKSLRARSCWAAFRFIGRRRAGRRIEIYNESTVRIFGSVAVLLAALFFLDDACAQALKNRAPLAPNRFDPLPLGSVRPRGWLARQLRIQADGLSGHLDEFWPDVGPNSGWLGGTGESWERGPYFLDGLVPLAYVVDDQRLIGKARRWVDWAITQQRPDGSLGPEKNQDWWPNMIML